MANGIVSDGKFSEALLDKNVKVWVAKGAQALADQEPYYRMLASHTPTNEEVFKIMDGVERGEFVEIPENGKPQEETDLPGFKTIFQVRDFGLQKSISNLAGRADASAHAQKQNSSLARSVGAGYVRKLNRDVAEVVLNGFNTAFTSYGDDKPFFSTQHTRIDGGSTTNRSNASSTSIALNYENLKSGRSQIRRTVDHAGHVVDYRQKKLLLIIPPALEDAAYEAIGSSRHLFKTDSADFTPNALQANGMIEPMVNPLLGAEAGFGGTNTNWYLKVADLEDGEAIQVYHRQQLQTRQQKDFYTKKHEVIGDAAWAIGWTDPVGKWFGSKGDGTAYSD